MLGGARRVTGPPGGRGAGAETRVDAAALSARLEGCSAPPEPAPLGGPFARGRGGRRRGWRRAGTARLLSFERFWIGGV